MVSKTVVTIICDLPHDRPVEGAETISFALDGTGYEVDVCDEHAEDLHDIFSGYVDHARRPAGQPARRRRDRTKSGRDRSADIRQWAREQGVEVNDRGRLPAALVREYDASH